MGSIKSSGSSSRRRRRGLVTINGLRGTAFSSTRALTLPTCRLLVSLSSVSIRFECADLRVDHGEPDGNEWREGHTSNSKHGPYLSVLKTEVLKRIEVTYTAELDRALRGLQPHIRTSVLARLPSLASSIQRVVQSSPEYSGLATTPGEPTPFSIPPGFDPTQVFETSGFLESIDEYDFGATEPFDFGFFHNQDLGQPLGQPQDDQACQDYPSSYPSDDFSGTAASSNTSFEDHYGNKSAHVDPHAVMPSGDVQDVYCQPYSISRV
jgi:hypothetical protein